MWVLVVCALAVPAAGFVGAVILEMRAMSALTRARQSRPSASERVPFGLATDAPAVAVEASLAVEPFEEAKRSVATRERILV